MKMILKGDSWRLQGGVIGIFRVVLRIIKSTIRIIKDQNYCKRSLITIVTIVSQEQRQ